MARAHPRLHRRGSLARALPIRETTRCTCTTFPAIPEGWRDDALAEKWETVRAVRRAVTGALELERAAKRIARSSLEAAPKIYIYRSRLSSQPSDGVDLAEISITSGATLIQEARPQTPSRCPSRRVSASCRARCWKKCARSWRITAGRGLRSRIARSRPATLRLSASSTPRARA